MPKFAANLTMMFNEVPFLDRFSAAAEAGFDAVEFLFPYEHPADEVANRASEAGVKVVLFNLPPGNFAEGERGIAVFPERSAEFSKYLATAVHYARMLGVPQLHLMAGIAPRKDAGAASRYRDALREASDALGEAGRDLLIEPLNPGDMPGYFLNDFTQAVDLIGELGLRNLKLQYDIYHRQLLHGNVLRSLEALMPIIGHVQTASVPLRHEPGTGELDDLAIFRALDRLGYAGYVGCEYRPAAGTVEGLAWRGMLHD
jgi:hydroxypyruvate isomerase